MTNCKNCGAPLDFRTPKCAYCGTTYADETQIEIFTTWEEPHRLMDGTVVRTKPMKTVIRRHFEIEEEL